LKKIFSTIHFLEKIYFGLLCFAPLALCHVGWYFPMALP